MPLNSYLLRPKTLLAWKKIRKYRSQRKVFSLPPVLPQWDKDFMKMFKKAELVPSTPPVFQVHGEGRHIKMAGRGGDVVGMFMNEITSAPKKQEDQMWAGLTMRTWWFPCLEVAAESSILTPVKGSKSAPCHTGDSEQLTTRSLELAWTFSLHSTRARTVKQVILPQFHWGLWFSESC